MTVEQYKDQIINVVMSDSHDTVDLLARMLKEGEDLRQMLSNAGLRVTGEPPLSIVQELIDFRLSHFDLINTLLAG